ncbi:DNA ligase [Coprinopsis sp. MPI-PUGE-AT-0042]|nr:DNA ligase [Coprinopsis sp. MPI-PUGE-AT-0042]
MSKRANADSSSTPQKRTKLKNNGQLSLDAFLSPSKGKSKATSRNPSPLAMAEVIDVDALEDKEDDRLPTPSASSSKVAFTSTLPSSPSKKLVGFTATKAVDYAFKALDIHPALYALDDQPWPTNEAPYAFLVHAMATLSGTKSRIAIVNTLTNTLATIAARHPASLLPSLYHLSNAFSPPYVATELGIGSSVLSKAIQHVSGLSAGALRKLYNSTGDVGDVAFAAKSKVRTLIPHAPLTVPVVYDSMLKIARCKGQGASQQKEKIVEKLLVAGRGEEIRFLVRTLAQNLRVGAVRTSILTALARAMALHFASSEVPPSSLSLYASSDLIQRVAKSLANKKSSDPASEDELKAIFANAEATVKEVYVQHPCYDDIVAALLQHGLPYLGLHVPLTVGIPLHPTLGSPTRSLNEIYERLGDAAFSAELKYDGQRAQIHVTATDGKPIVKLFSRHLEDMTTKYPDIVALMESLVAQSSSTTRFILDAEIVAIDPVTGDLRSFQELSNRSRKDVQLDDIKVPVCVYAFDLLYHNDESLLSTPFRERRRLLRTHFASTTPDDTRIARFDFVESCESTEGMSVVADFWERAVAGRCEGLMVKVLDSMAIGETEATPAGRTSRKARLPATYEPDKRTSAWLKLKKDYVEGIGDSLDLVPIGGWFGNGRKAGWWSPILLGLWDPSLGKVVAMCKCMSGFTDAFYKKLSETYSLESDNCSNQSSWGCELGGFRPDVYFKPKEVWEIRGADITDSPVSIAARGLVPGNRGLSLRFPRFIRLRPDKAIEEANSPDFLVNIWRQQRGKPAATGADEGDLVDYMSEESIVEEEDSDLDI